MNAKWVAVAFLCLIASSSGYTQETAPPDPLVQEVKGEPQSPMPGDTSAIPMQDNTGTDDISGEGADAEENGREEGREQEITDEERVGESDSVFLISITSIPEGADVVVDGKDVGKTPLNLSDIAPGEHSLELRKPGFFLKKARIRVPEGKSAQYEFDLLAPACLTVVSEPQQAVVQIKGRRLGTTPLESCKLRPGTYEVRIGADGFKETIVSVELHEGPNDTISVRLEKVPAAEEEDHDELQADPEKESTDQGAEQSKRGESSGEDAVQDDEGKDSNNTVRLIVLSVFVLFGVGILIAELSGP